MLNIHEIEILHLKIVEFINKIPNNLYIKNCFIINLPSILIDIIDLCNFSDKEWEEKEWILDRVIYGFESNFYKVNAKLFLKKLFTYKNKEKIFIPILERKSQKVEKLIFDSVICENLGLKELKKQYISSVSSVFFGKFSRKDSNKELITVINKFIFHLNSIDFLREFFEIYNFRLMQFKSKLILSSQAAYFRFKQCKKNIPKNVKAIYLPTLYSPFNRTIALVGIENGSKIISFDHGTGVAFPKSKTSINIELDLTSEYITFSDLFREIILKNISQELRCKNKRIPLVNTPQLFSKPEFKKKNFSDFKNILYVPSVISNKAHIPPLLNPSEYLQLQLNILRNLKLIGSYKLFLKEHPETEANIPEVVLNELKISVLYEKVEKLNKEFIFLIDYLQTTCLRFAISNNIPIIAVVVDKNVINKQIFSELCALPNFEYIIPKKNSRNYYIDKDQILSLIENLKINYSPDHENCIFGNLF